MNSARLQFRTFLLLTAEAALLFGAVVAAANLRLGAGGAFDELTNEHGYLKAAVAALFCLGTFYLFDLYDFARMHDRRELVLRLIQALGLAWVALACVFYVAPWLMLGRGVSLIALVLALLVMILWRAGVHWLMGHPNVGERLLVVGSGATAIEIAREVMNRPDVGFRVVGFVDNQPELVGQSLINPRVIGVTSELPAIIRRERINRIIVAMGERRGQFPTEQLLSLSLMGDVQIEESAFNSIRSAQVG